MTHFALIDAAGVVVSRVHVDGEEYDPGEGLIAIEVTERPEIFAGATWTKKGGFVPLPPVPVPAVIRNATAKQFRYALNAMGVRPAWDTALAAASADTRDYWDTEPNPPESNSKLKRLAIAAKVDLKALYDLAATL